MYREPPPICCLCGDATDAHAADVTDAGLRCRRCTDAVELAAIQPALAEARAAQMWWAKNHPAYSGALKRHCSRHVEWDTRCFWCVLADWLPDDWGD